MKHFQTIQDIFKEIHTPEERYQKIIELGRTLLPLDPSLKIPENIVKGCQSIVYLSSELQGSNIFFHACSDSLISAGLAAILIKAYSGLSPKEVIKEKPTFLEDLGISTSLTPGRSNGLASMYLRMQQDALKFLVNIS